MEVGRVGKANEDITLILYRFSDGEKARPAMGSDSVHLSFLSRSDEWKFLKLSDMHILVGGRRIKAARALGDSSIHVGGVSERVTGTVTFDEFQAVAASDRVEIAVGTAEFLLSFDQIRTFRRFVAELKLDAAAMEAIAKEERRQAEAQAEEDRKAQIVWEAKVAKVYPEAKKALTEAKNRGAQAALSVRKAATKRETEKAASALCEAHDLTRTELDRLMTDGKALEERSKKKPASGQK